MTNDMIDLLAPAEGEMKDKILNWFATGHVGASAKVMACAAAGIDSNERNHPYDPSDLNRCLLLLVEVPEILQHFDKVAAISDTWAKLIARWDEVEQCFLDEVGRNWCKAHSAPKTYNLMKAIGC